jgi:hypothetical protein
MNSTPYHSISKIRFESFTSGVQFTQMYIKNTDNDKIIHIRYDNSHYFIVDINNINKIDFSGVKFGDLITSICSKTYAEHYDNCTIHKSYHLVFRISNGSIYIVNNYYSSHCFDHDIEDRVPRTHSSNKIFDCLNMQLFENISDFVYVCDTIISTNAANVIDYGVYSFTDY